MRSRRPRQLSFHDYRMRSGRGGPRKGAGRKPSARPVIHHVGRESFSDLRAGHVTVRVSSEIPDLRCESFVDEIRRSFRQTCERGDFRLVHYSVQSDHVHLVVEAHGSDAMGRGMKSLSSRIARAVNRVFGHMGKVLEGRYHLHLLKTVAEAWNALRYVLLNAHKHFWRRFGQKPPPQVDWASSGRHFEGWAHRVPGTRDGPREAARPQSWLLREGWKRKGLIDPCAIPGI